MKKKKEKEATRAAEAAAAAAAAPPPPTKTEPDPAAWFAEEDTQETDTASWFVKEEPKPQPAIITPAPEPAKPFSPVFETAVPAEVPTQIGSPILVEQSKARSASFRAGSISGKPMSPGPLSPEIETAPDIYRKHVARIDELERENRRLAKESGDAEKRWKKAEDELADLREAETESKKTAGSETDKLVRQLEARKCTLLTSEQKEQIASLERQNSQLQQQARGSFSGHRPSASTASPPSDLQAELDSKSATIESMETEISKLRAQVERQATGSSAEKEQIAALEDKVRRAESAAGQAQRELQDAKANLERTAEKAIREGSERTSAETKIKTLEQKVAELEKSKAEDEQKTEGLEKKIATLTTLHKEQDSRAQTLKQEKDVVGKDVTELRAKVIILESENAKLKTGRKSVDGGGGLDDDGMDELENEERERLQKKIRNLEQELHDLRSGAWIQRRREMEGSGEGFQEIDLSGDTPKPQTQHQHPPPKKNSTGGGFGDFFSNGLNALAGGDDDDDDFLEDDDDEFDEDAFRKAQQEEQMRHVERVKELKRGLKHWEGWRLDLVDLRRGGGEGVGDIFDV